MIIKQTTLDLNGPELSFTVQPQSQTVNSGDSVVFTGNAVASFPTQDPINPATNTGTIVYQWYVQGDGAPAGGQLSDGLISSLGATFTGSSSPILTVSNVTNPTSNGLSFYLEADYVSTAYADPQNSPVTVGTARSTGNAINDPHASNLATLTVNPTISVTSHPSNQEVAEGLSATFTASATASDGSEVGVQWQLNGVDLTDSSTVAGSTSNTLTIALPSASTNDIRAKFTHPTASNSPIFSNSATFAVVLARAMVNYEFFGSGQRRFGSFNLADQPNDTYTFYSDKNLGSNSTVLYVPEKDVEVEIEVAGAAGDDSGSRTGGHGGVTTIRYTLQQNREYVLKIGHANGYGLGPKGGTPNGGGATFFHHGGIVITVGGGGGGASSGGNGGDGGGAGQAGQSGTGSGAGSAGSAVSNGTMPGTGGSFANGTVGGQLESCTLGKYWAQQGVSPCSFMGFGYLINAIGNVVSGTTNTIIRGFKEGIAYRNNGGKGSYGGGGAGARGGNASTSNGGGGGGSGYWNGEGTFVSAIRGGNTSIVGYVKITALSTETITQNITDTQGTLNVSSPFTITRYISPGLSGTEGHPIGSILYTVNISGYIDPELSASVIDNSLRASGLTDSNNSIAVSAGYPKKISANTYEVAFDMDSSQTAGQRQATFVRSFNLTMTAKVA